MRDMLGTGAFPGVGDDQVFGVCGANVELLEELNESLGGID
jgi:hypothetical protein